MRQAEKKQAEELVRLLGKVHDEINKGVKIGRTEASMVLLSQCQDAAIQLGEMIEQTEGEGFVTVRLLEEYCEEIYQIYEDIRQGRERDTDKSLQKVLIPVENSVKHDIRIRREVVFLPYKAAMWDSLESIWKAADEDPDCDAFVIPIPYYDKNSDGSFREEHYEGGLYPNYVPVIWYGDYDFQTRRPDMIWIHNPYDRCNYVTSVHPFFYAENLRQYTDRLIYIPYFVLEEIEPDCQEEIDRMKHFCFLPGVIYAHKVIVQSENMRRIYISEYEKAAKENGLSGEHIDKAFLGEKILGLGSPKMDNVLSEKNMEPTVSDEWKKIMERPDGSLKKVVFYNSGIGALLKHGEQMLDKMEDVLRIFKSYGGRIALLWRPHPLLESTLLSMRPLLWERYKKIRDRYISEGWGIYDDTADLERAIKISDIYYGDGSSVAQLFRKAGKPVMVQNVGVLRNDKEK